MPQTNQELVVSKIPVTLSQDNQLPIEFKILPIAQLKTWVGDIDITDELAAAMVANFNQGIPHQERKIPIDELHQDGKAPGWITRLIHKAGDGIYAAGVEWTQYGAGLIKDKLYSYISADFHTNYIDSSFGNEHGPVLRAVALTNKPMLEILPSLFSQDAGQALHSNSKPIQILFSQEGEIMNLEEIRAKAADQLTAEEKTFLTDHTADLTADERTTFGIAEPNADGAGDGDDQGDGADGGDGNDQGAGDSANAGTDAGDGAGTNTPTDQGTQLSQTKGQVVQLSQVQFQALQNAANAGAAAKVELDRNRMHKTAESFIFSQSNGDGVFLPKTHDKLTNFMFSLSQNQLTAFNELMSESPKGLLQLTQEVGDGGAATTSGNVLNDMAQAKLNAAVKAGNKDFTFSQAIEEVIREKPELGRAEYGI